MQLFTGIRSHPAAPLVVLALAFVMWAYAFPPADAGLTSVIQNASAVFVHLALIVATLLSARRAPSREEARFYLLFAAGFAVWMLLDILPGTPSGIPQGHPVDVFIKLLEDAAYMAFFAFVLIAVETRPHLGAMGDAARGQWRSRLTADVILVAALYVYFSVFPALLSSDVFYTYAPSSYLFGILDALLVVRLVHVGGMCDSPRWRAVYTTIAAGFAVWFVSDTLAGLENASVVTIISDGMYNVLHFAPFFIMMMAVSVPAGPSEGDIEPRGMFERRSAGGVTGQLLVYAMILPLVHLSMYSAGLLDGRTGTARTALVLVTAGAFLVLAEMRRRRMLTGRDGAITVVVSDEELAQVQRMEALGRLAGGVAHDFSNLLTAIRGYAELGMGDATARERADFFQQIRMTTERGKALTSQLLAFSRKQVFEVKPVDLNRVIDEARDMLARLLGADVELVTGLERNLGRVNGEPGQLLQVVVNLVVNAREAMPDGGTVTIRTANVELERGESAGGGAPAGSFVLLEVADTGCGMDAETRRRAFEPFYTTRGHGDGTGLGLATVYGIVRQCGGSIHVDSEPGQGTVMHVFLPRSLAAEAAGPTVVAAAPVTAIGTETILLAEDEPSVREVTGRYLSGLGYEVFPAANGVEAMEVVRRSGRSIDLLLTDVVMPEAGGRQLARDLGELQPGVQVVYMSGHVDVAGESFSGAGVNFIQKPFSLTELGKVVRRALDDERRTAS